MIKAFSSKSIVPYNVYKLTFSNIFDFAILEKSLLSRRRYITVKSMSCDYQILAMDLPKHGNIWYFPKQINFSFRKTKQYKKPHEQTKKKPTQTWWFCFLFYPWNYEPCCLSSKIRRKKSDFTHTWI